MAKVHVLYVPGLGDWYDPLRRLALQHWKKSRQDVEVTFLPMRWKNLEEPCAEKFERIRAEIRRRHGSRIVLIGESAGGSAVIACGLGDPSVESIITLCGKNIGSQSVSPRLYEKHPALREAITLSEMAIAAAGTSERARLTTFYSSLDTTVRPIDTKVEGAEAIDLNIPGHFSAILYCLTRGKSKLLDRIEKS